MAPIVCKHPGIRIDIMVKQKFWPMMASIMQKTGCKYYKEDWLELPNGSDYIVLRDVKAEKPYMLGNMFAQLHILEAEDQEGDGKFYVLIKPKKRGKKHVQKDRQEADSGSQSGDGGESGNTGSAEDPGTRECGAEPPASGTDNFRQLEMFESIDEVAVLDNNH